MAVTIIGEAGSTHGRNLDNMYQLIDLAKEAGCDVVKMQWCSKPEKLCAQRNAPQYRQAYELIAWPIWWHERMRDRCERAGIEYMCTAYLQEDIATVNAFVKRFKIASFEAHSKDFIKAHQPFRKSVVISTGMMDRYDLVRLVGRRQDYHFQILHCVSAYPAPAEAMNLAVIQKHDLDGLSDHSSRIDMGALAVCAGARIIERHFRLEDTPMDNADYAVSLDPKEFKAYVRHVRDAEKIMGTSEKAVQKCEAEMSQYRVTK